MKPLIIGNWKMNPASRREAETLARSVRRGIAGSRRVEVAIAPPFPFLESVGKNRGSVALAAQDVFWEQSGAYTGEVSAAMLRDFGARYVIVGHSERRRIRGEDDAVVNRKIRAALRARLIPVLAIGEGANAGGEVVPKAIGMQLAGALAGIPKAALAGTVVAYEPVWAVGTGNPDTPDNATRRAIYIRKLLADRLGRRIADSIRILYGGSVQRANAASFIAHDIRGMEGLLVGGASLKADEFVGIVCAVAGRGKG